MKGLARAGETSYDKLKAVKAGLPHDLFSGRVWVQLAPPSSDLDSERGLWYNSTRI